MATRRTSPKATSTLRREAKAIFRAGLDSVRAERVMADEVALEKTRAGERLRVGAKRFTLPAGGRLILVGAGKASSHMARAVERRLGRRITGGAVVTQRGYAVGCRRVEILEAAHPVPDAAGLRAAEKIGGWIDGAGPDDLIICLLSGGGSALLPAPAEGISLGDKREATDALLKAGAPIEALNCVRKHLSLLKGGHLARRAAPARVITLAISDVVGDPLDVIASGPATGDPTTFADARSQLRAYGVWKKAPESVRRHILRGIAGKIPDTPTPSDPLLRRVHTRIVADNDTALRAAAQKARTLGLRPMILTRRLQGEAREIGEFLAGLARGIRTDGYPARPPVCILLGGETTVTVSGKGLGGRCQELALAFSLNLGEGDGICLLAAGTDGKDGPTRAAGAIVHSRTLQIVKKQGIDARSFLSDNNSHSFFGSYGELISTGPTGTNVMDLIVLVVR